MAPPPYRTKKNDAIYCTPTGLPKINWEVTEVGSLDVDFKSTGQNGVNRGLTSYKDGKEAWLCCCELCLLIGSDGILFTAGSGDEIWAGRRFNYRTWPWEASSEIPCRTILKGLKNRNSSSEKRGWWDRIR